MSLTYGDEVTLTSTYVATSQLTGPLTAAWSCDKFAFDKTTSTVTENKQVQANPDGTTTDYFIYTATITAKATTAGSTTLWSQIGGNPAKVNGIDGVAVKVAKKRIDVPTADKTVFVYQKDLKQYPQFAENDAYTVTIPAASTEIGTYTATLALKDAANTEWNSVDKDGKPVYDDAANKSITYSIVEHDFEAELAKLQEDYNALVAENKTLKADNAAKDETIGVKDQKIADKNARIAKLKDKLKAPTTLKKSVKVKYAGKTYTISNVSKSGKTITVKVK